MIEKFNKFITVSSGWIGFVKFKDLETIIYALNELGKKVNELTDEVNKLNEANKSK